MANKSFRYDLLNRPARGHALNELLEEKGTLLISWSGQFTFTDIEGYKSLTFYDDSLPDSEKEIDNKTGLAKHIRTYDQVSQFLPTWNEVETRYALLEAEYDAYAAKRARVYPDVKDQLDMLYKDINAGLLGESAKTSSFYQAIAAAKTGTV